MKYTLFCLSALIAVSFSLSAQEQVKSIKTTSLSLMPHFSIGSGANASLDDFHKLAPESTLLPTDLNGYTTNNYLASNASLGNSILLGFKFANKEKSGYRPNPILRVGVSYYYDAGLYNSIYQNDRHPYDTLISVKTGVRTAVDSVSYSGYDMAYTSQQLRLDASLIYRTNPEARWNFFGGIGFTFGGSINAETRINGYQYSYISPEDNQNVAYYNSSNDYNYEQEVVQNENNLAYSVYVPLGLDFRIANKSEFWKRVHLFYEMRPSLNGLSIPELKTYTSVSWQHGLGLKVQWN